jgi:hypothetical protein
MLIAVVRLASAAAMAALFAALAGCASVGPDVSGGGGGATEQARLRLTDQCVYEASKTANALKDRITPRCQCYARGALRQMSPGEIASVAGGGSVPFTVRSQEIMNACTTHANAFADAPRKTSAKKRKKPAPDEASPPAEPPAAETPPPANTPAPPANGGEPPKQ